MSKVYIIHGYLASPGDHWFPWLEKRIAALGAAAETLAMPDAENPNAADWDAHLDAVLGSPDPDVFFVAHSLGCVALLRYLARQRGGEFGGMVLVSGFCDPLADLPQLDDFVRFDWQPDSVRQRVRQCAVIASRDDAIVPWSYTETLSRKLRAPLHSVDHGGHFLGSEGFTELPLVFDEVRAMFTG